MFCLLPASSVAACVVQRRSSKAVAEHQITHRLLFILIYAWQAEDLQMSQSDLYMLWQAICASTSASSSISVKTLLHVQLAQEDGASTSTASCNVRPVM